jgi:hypothetical protein
VGKEGNKKDLSVLKIASLSFRDANKHLATTRGFKNRPLTIITSDVINTIRRILVLMKVGFMWIPVGELMPRYNPQLSSLININPGPALSSLYGELHKAVFSSKQIPKVWGDVSINPKGVTFP